jgi:transmembrane sensor
MTGRDIVLDQAIDWHLRLADGDTDVWHRFVEWLEADAAHADAYDRVASDDRLLDDRDDRQPVFSIVPSSPPHTDMRRKRGAVWGAGIAAVLAGVVGLVTYLRPAADAPYSIVAPVGQSRQAILADGTRITVHPNGRLRLDRADPRMAVVEKGEALFQVRHDAAHPFRVEAAGRMIEDLGTVFDVATHGSELRVAVAEGSVSFHSGENHILLKPGMMINVAEDDQIEIRHVDAGAVGGWRRGHVDFDDVTLSEVVRQVRLSNGVSIAISPDLGSQRFSGVIRTDRGSDEIVRSLAQLSGTRAVRVAAGWMLERSAAQ